MNLLASLPSKTLCLYKPPLGITLPLMKYFFYCPVVLLMLLPISGFQHKKAYQFFDQKGKSTDYKQLLAEAQKADIILFGEQHNNPICHWLQLSLTQDLYKEKQQQLALGAEMFEADNQLIVDEYLQSFIQEKHLKKEAKVWPNYDTDYASIVNFAKEKGIPFTATNIPRRYASLVSKKGIQSLDSLSESAKKFMAPLPIAIDKELPNYKKMAEMMGAHAGSKSAGKFVEAQAVKDATMAHFILQNRKAGQTFLHFNGSFHSDNFEGIVWYLKQQNPKLKILTISHTEQKSLEQLNEDSKGVASFVLVTPATMTKTY